MKPVGLDSLGWGGVSTTSERVLFSEAVRDSKDVALLIDTSMNAKLFGTHISAETNDASPEEVSTPDDEHALLASFPEVPPMLVTVEISSLYELRSILLFSSVEAPKPEPPPQVEQSIRLWLTDCLKLNWV